MMSTMSFPPQTSEEVNCGLESVRNLDLMSSQANIQTKHAKSSRIA
jgi:hypothetical protein